MRTTIRIRDELLARAKKMAAQEGRTLTSLVDEGFAIVLAASPAKRRRVRPPISKSKGGVLPGADLNRSSDLTDLLKRIHPPS